MNSARIVEECVLPSRGEIYEEAVNPNVVLSSMTTRHEMLRLSNTDESQEVMASILDDCIESDMGISAYDLCLGDYQYLLLKLRVVTFGPEYQILTKCPVCGFEQITDLNLDELEVKELDNELEELLSFKLPRSGIDVRLTLQTPRMLDRITTKSKEYMRRNKSANENPNFLYTLVSSIEEWDGGTPNPIMLENEIKNLELADANFLRNRIDLVNSKIGVNLMSEEVCKVCSTSYLVPFRYNATFFRPDTN